ncbi:NB-ARC domain-containing protein, partial [Rivularia sp. UHCC 0363]|uniref:NB-ARC domain-containing protein n=1 Tax=Rivularia sp. UHCC 0363 TaxID=3110244 RepID=UPI002B21F6F2
MQELHQRLQASEQLAITAATGMGGIGKTDLAWHYAYDHQADYSGGIWWLSAAQLVLKVLEYSLLMGLDIPPEDADAAAKVQWCYQKWLEAIPTGARLLVWDDVGDAEAYGELRPYLPTDARFRLLITTRAKLGHPVQRLELDVLEPAAALELLGQLVGDEARLVAEAETAKALCQWLGYLPLGIELVGRHLALHPNLKLATLLSRLETQKLNARAMQQVAPEMPYRDSLAAAFEISWQGLSEAAQQLGGLLSLFGLAPVSKALIVDCLPEWDEEDLEDALDLALVGSSLLTVLETGEYLLHSLIREFFAGKLQAFSTAEALQRGFVLALTEVAKTVPYTVTLNDLARTENTMLHMEAAALYSALLSDEDCFWPHIGLARLYESQSLWQQAEQWSGDCLKMTEARFGKQHPAIATSLNNLAGLYYS